MNDNYSLPEQPKSSTEMLSKKSRKGKSLLGLFISIAIILLIVLLTLDYFKIISLSKIFSSKINFSIPFLTKESEKPPLEIIAKVGTENIYQKDLDYELQNYPPLKDVDSKKLLLDKIIKDSIILQAAQTDGIVKLDETVFNSVKKDYLRRMDLIKSIKNKIEQKSDNISGAVVSLWFYNRAPGKVGYDKGREIALSTITKLHDEVVKKVISIQQAGQEIRNDPKLGSVDVAYLSNALLEFNQKPSDTIVFDPGFDSKIKNLSTGQVTDVYLAKSKQWVSGKPTETMIDSIYMFAQVSGKKKTNIAGFDEWYNQNLKTYAVTYY